MKKLLLGIMLILVGSSTSALAGDPVVSISTATSYQATASNSYTSTWKLQDGDKTWSVVNFNNNNKSTSWNCIKCGSKSAASQASIATDFAIPEKIGSVTVNMALTSTYKTNLTSLTLEVSSSSDFAADATTSYSATNFQPTTASDVVIEIDSPIENGYYRLNFNCTKASNGFCAVYNIGYYGAEEVKAIAKPTFTEGEGDNSFNISLACETEGAKIYYTTDGNDPSDQSTPYTEPIEFKDPINIKAIAISGNEASNIATYTKNGYFRTDFNGLLALEDVPSAGVSAVVKNTITAIYQKTGNLYVKANDSYMLIYGTLSQTLNNGDTFPRIAGTYQLYNALPEITNPTLGEITSGGDPVKPIVITDISTITDATLNAYVQLTGVSLENTTITDAQGKTIALYKKFSDITVPTSGSNLSITGFVNSNKGTLQIIPIEVSEIPVLGDITGTTSDDTAIVEDSEIAITEGDVLTFYVANAESIKVYDNSNAEAVEITDNVVFDSETSKLTWTPAVADMRIISVVATLAEETKTINFYLTVNPKPEGLGEIKITAPEDAEFDSDNHLYTIDLGEKFTFAADNADDINIAVKYADSEGSRIKKADTDDIQIAIAEWTPTEAKLYELTVTATNGTESKSITINVKVNFILTGALANGDEITDGETYDVTAGSKLTFSAKNAEKISIISDNETVATADDSALVFAPTVDDNGKTFTVTATHGDANTTLTFTLNVTKQTVFTPVVKFDTTIQNWVSYAKDNTIVWTSDIDGLTFNTVCSATGTTYATIADGVLKVYGSNGNEISISAPEGYKMTKLLFTIDTANSNSNIPQIDGVDCTIVETPASSKKKAESVWADYAYTFTEPATNCVLSPSTSKKNLQIKSVAITLNMTETGISTIADDQTDNNAETIYYNLQGLRVKADKPGLYIRCRGTKVDKVILH